MCFCWLFLLSSQSYAIYTQESLINPIVWDVTPQGVAVVTPGIGKTIIGRDCPLLKIDIKDGSRIRISQTIKQSVPDGYSLSFFFQRALRLMP